jgi:protein-S-isoprenylcysteine O-methyltransferase Ste14
MKRLETKIPPPLLGLVSVMYMGALKRWWGVASLFTPPYNQIGIFLIVLGIGMVVACFFQFRRFHTTIDPRHPNRASQLVTSGLFKYSRNPMYLGMLLVLTGWAVTLGSIGPWLGPVVFYFWMTRLQIMPEERALRERFGSGYVSYCERVGRWLF